MKWKDFKKIIESQGVEDETEIMYVDTDMFSPSVVTNCDGTVHIE